ncbi:hypothetical protein HHK36_027223 [Tetracentron sinense]|uniref:Ku C-terminal domain-containing protein n=1 Tax=Tetracentron sinense TaxID=13715 RepID=A0A835D2U5_TETSI|nr:hypothetical protein HHK36_027223 [Tetracentron sinense]
MTAHGMRLDCIIVRGKLSGDANDHLLNQFAKKTHAKMVHFNSPTSLLGALRTRNISLVSPTMKIQMRLRMSYGNKCCQRIGVVCLHLRHTKAILCVSAITRVMKEMDTVAILRCVWRHEQRSVVVGVLTPNVSNRDNISTLPYLIDLSYPIDSASLLILLSSKTRFTLMDFLLLRMFENFGFLPSAISLSHGSRTNNSKMQQITWSSYLTLHHQVKRKLCSLILHLILFWRLTLLFSAACSTNLTPVTIMLGCLSHGKWGSFVDANEHGIETQSVYGERKHQGQMRERERDGVADIGDVQTVNSIENASIAKVVKIGDLTPVQDFEAMISRRDSIKRVNKAIRDMKKVIFDLVENSYEGYTYEKALESLVALHKGYILE